LKNVSTNNAPASFRVRPGRALNTPELDGYKSAQGEALNDPIT